MRGYHAFMARVLGQQPIPGEVPDLPPPTLMALATDATAVTSPPQHFVPVSPTEANETIQLATPPQKKAPRRQ